MYTKEELHYLGESMKSRMENVRQEISHPAKSDYDFLCGYSYAIYLPDEAAKIIEGFKKEYL